MTTARETLRDIFSNPTKVTKTIMSQTEQDLLGACYKKRANPWKRNPLTGKTVTAARYNDRSGREIERSA